MMQAGMYSQTVTFLFSLFVLCFITCTISGLVLFLFKARRANEELRHPLLQHRPFKQYPFAIQASIMLDYFLRLAFPRTKWWLIGHANKQLAHVDPKRVPLDVKWPIIGFWGACWLGLLAMISCGPCCCWACRPRRRAAASRSGQRHRRAARLDIGARRQAGVFRKRAATTCTPSGAAPTPGIARASPGNPMNGRPTWVSWARQTRRYASAPCKSRSSANGGSADTGSNSTG